MADMLIKNEADATGWHNNLCCEAPYLTDGWAVVPSDSAAMVRNLEGIVTFQVDTAPMADYPDIVDRRTAGRGQPYPVAAHMEAGTYVPPLAPETTPISYIPTPGESTVVMMQSAFATQVSSTEDDQIIQCSGLADTWAPGNHKVEEIFNTRSSDDFGQE